MDQERNFGEREDGRCRVVIEGVHPELEEGRFPIKRTVGEEVIVSADIFADGHDVVAAVLRFRHAATAAWSETPMVPVRNDRWQGSFTVTDLGCYVYTLQAWINHFQSWRRDLEKKLKAGQDVTIDLAGGVPLLAAAEQRAQAQDSIAARELKETAQTLSRESQLSYPAKAALALSPRLAQLMERFGERKHAVSYERELRVVVDPIRARFSAWYEMFPRSAGTEAGVGHGTFRDCEAWLPRIAQMGFDVLYLPPIHPIGSSYRKGRNNTLACHPDDPGSPWAIGSEEGGHKAIHPRLGTLEDFRHLQLKARELDIEIALDMAFQCSPDHPYVREHPEWFRHRSDGSVQYAENPPKKYQDIYPFDFECEHWQALWRELKSVLEFWIEQGVSVFRVDNPHTKPFRFWEWCLGELKAAHPQVIFLSEAFTRPKVMYYLAKAGFSQSYTYFPWRNTKQELTDYLGEVSQSEIREYFRPSLWPNTPDILTQYLRYGGRAAFMARFILAATLGAAYGIYGPAFELCDNQGRDPESEEYLNSEKYEIKQWKLDAAGSLAGLIGRVNQIRREHPALQSNESLRFHTVDNEQLMAYSKTNAAQDEIMLMVVNLDPHHRQQGWLTVPLADWKLSARDSFQLHDLLTDAHYLWNGPRNYIELDPQFVPAHLFHLRRYVRTEQDFDYFA